MKLDACSEIPSSSMKDADMLNLEDEDEEVLVEPRFKYSRILSDVSRLAENDSASYIAIHDKFLAIGSGSGRIYLFDHEGNTHHEFTARHHKCAVTCISIDPSGNYLVSCANDFTVSIYGIGGGDEFNQCITLKASAKAVAIAPDFSRSGSGQRCVYGSSFDLILSERKPIIGRREKILYKGLEKDGVISAISWNKIYVAFTNESGTRIYDLKLSRIITLIQPLHRTERYYSTKFPAKHAWFNESNIAVGWANTICICRIIEKQERNDDLLALNSSILNKYGQILHQLILPDFLIAGISFTSRQFHQEFNISISNGNETQERSINNGIGPTSQTVSAENDRLQAMTNKNGRSELVVFGIKVGSETDTLGKNSASSGFLDDTRSSISEISTRSTATIATITMLNELSKDKRHFSAQLLLISPTDVKDYELIAEDTIEMKHVDPRYLQRFFLGSLIIDNIFFLMGPREVIQAEPCSIDDRIKWLIENELFADALELAVRNANRLRKVDPTDVGKKYINHLIEHNNFNRASKYLSLVCQQHKHEWETYVNEFEKHGQILQLAPVLPTKEPKLEPECYEAILKAALYSKPKLFKALVWKWDGYELYRTPFIISITIRRMTEDSHKLSRDDGADLSRALAQLYVYNQQFEKAIKIYLKLGDSAIFGIINRHKLFTLVKDRIIELMNISTDQAIRLLLDNVDLIPSQQIVTQLGKAPKLQFTYLQKLHNQGGIGPYANKYVQLLADYDRPSLLSFLRKNEHYRIDFALDVCRQKNLTEEVVFLLGKSGNRLEALELIINGLAKIEKAIDFCMAHDDDPELWQRLIDLAMSKPEYISRLLTMAGTYVDPLMVIEKIPPDTRIPGLKGTLIKVLQDCQVRVRLLEQSQSTSILDLKNNFMTRIQNNCFGIFDATDSEGNTCQICKEPLITTTTDSNSINIPSKSLVDGIRLCTSGKHYHERCYVLQEIDLTPS